MRRVPAQDQLRKDTCVVVPFLLWSVVADRSARAADTPGHIQTDHSCKC